MSDLSEERKKEIETRVQEIRRKYNLYYPKFDLLKFLNEKEEFEIKSQFMNDETTGLLLVDDINYIQNSNTHRLIIVNQNLGTKKEFLQKRRFICAHEYGHFILHKNNSRKFARRDTRNMNSQEEIEAEYFAYCFLLPEQQLKMIFRDPDIKNNIDTLINKYKISCEEVIADIYNVSIKKASKRLQMLGLLQNV